MAYKNDHTVEDIKSVANIVDVVGRVVPLKRAGSNYKGCCPFHNEKTASFVVSESKQIFTCFGCGAKGDVIGFMQRYYNLDFREACEKLGAEYGIEVSFTGGNKEDTDRLYEINREAAAFFMRAMFTPGCKGYEYMTGRGISPETMKTFGIGYADGEWHSLRDHMHAKGYDDKTLISLGLLSEKNSGDKHNVYDKFRDRVMFPIINTSGKVIGFGGRIIGQGEPKYLNSAESSIFLKKNNLYAMNLTRKDVGSEDCAILVEGYMDVISLYQAGIRNVSASLGTALTENQAKLIKRYTKNVVLSYDADAAGRKAALRGIEILHDAGCDVRVLHVTDGKDPDEFVKAKGPEAYRKIVAGALGYADYKLADVKRRFPADDDNSRIDYMKGAATVIKGLSPVEQDIYIKKVAAAEGFSEGALRREVDGTKAPVQANPARERASRSGAEVSSQTVSKMERQLIKLLLTEPEKYKEIAIRKHVFRSAGGLAIFNEISKQLSGDNGGAGVDVKLLGDCLSDVDAALLNEIIDNEPIEGKSEQMLEQIFHTIERQDLEERQRELIQMLELADGTDDNSNEEALRDIMEELNFIHDKIEKLKL